MPECSKHEYRFGFLVGATSKVNAGQPVQPKALYYCIHCLHSKVIDIDGIVIPGVQVQLMQQAPPSGLLPFPRG